MHEVYVSWRASWLQKLYLPMPLQTNCIQDGLLSNCIEDTMVRCTGSMCPCTCMCTNAGGAY